MPRSPTTFTLPPGTTPQQPNTVISSAMFNAFADDVAQTFNTAQPIVYGGTGATTAVGGADALSPAFVNVASAATTNIGAASSPNVNVTGTTTITAFDSFAAAAKRLVKFTGVLTLTHNATTLILPGGSNITTAPGDFALFVSQGSGNWECVFYTYASGNSSSAVNAGYLYGLTISNNVTDPTNDIDIAVGAAASDGSMPALMTLATGLTKRLDAVWAVGTNQGMLASGAAIANTTYHIFLIKRPDTGVVDVAADTSVTGANIVANTNVAYTLARRIGSIVRTGGSIRAFVQNGNFFRWNATSVDYASSATGTAAVTATLGVPTGIKVMARVSANAAGAEFIYLSDLAISDQVPGAAVLSVSASGNPGGGMVDVVTNTSAQVRLRLQVGSILVTIATQGYFDSRGTPS